MKISRKKQQRRRRLVPRTTRFGRSTISKRRDRHAQIYGLSENDFRRPATRRTQGERAGVSFHLIFPTRWQYTLSLGNGRKRKLFTESCRILGQIVANCLRNCADARCCRISPRRAVARQIASAVLQATRGLRRLKIRMNKLSNKCNGTSDQRRSPWSGSVCMRMDVHAIHALSLALAPLAISHFYPA